MNLLQHAKCIFLLSLLATLIGCGGSGDGRVVDETEEQTALKDVARMLDDLSKAGEKPPATPADLEKFVMVYPYANTLMRTKKIEYFLGAAVDGSSPPKQVARQVGADTAGGWVLLSNGEVKKMTADELKSIPLGGKATKK